MCPLCDDTGRMLIRPVEREVWDVTDCPATVLAMADVKVLRTERLAQCPM
jgi:hypothetical protein